MPVQVERDLDLSVDRCGGYRVRHIVRSEVLKDHDRVVVRRRSEGFGQGVIDLGADARHRIRDQLCRVGDDALGVRIGRQQDIALGHVDRQAMIALEHLQGLVSAQGVCRIGVRQQRNHVVVAVPRASRRREGRIAEAVHRRYRLADRVQILVVSAAGHRVKVLGAILKRRHDREVAAGDLHIVLFCLSNVVIARKISIFDGKSAVCILS